MMFEQVVIVHGLKDAERALKAALADGRTVTLMSSPGAALYAGCGWWKSLIASARAGYPTVPGQDILDCADGTGVAMAALRIGICRLVLWPAAPGREAVVAIAHRMGGFVLDRPP